MRNASRGEPSEKSLVVSRWSLAVFCNRQEFAND
jgi:hypothetical protein